MIQDTHAAKQETRFDSQLLRIHRTKQLLLSRQLLIVFFLLIAALAIRLYHINEPPLGFHATRQYRSFIIARGYYYEVLTDTPEWKRQIVRFSQQKQGMLEPPIMEFIVAASYHLLGGENFWFPRLLSSLFWIIGGVFVYWIGGEIADRIAATFAMAFHLFLPFGIVASQSFQPDPLMVMLMLAGVFAILRYSQVSSYPRLAAAAAVSSLAFLVKPGSLFVLLGVFVALANSKQGMRQAVTNRPFLIFVAIVLTPTVLAYGYGMISGAFLIGEAEKTLLPQLWISTFFWRSWLANIGSTVGLIPFLGGLLGVLMFRQGLPRALMFGLWTGYTIFCLVLNYNLAAHDYYQLQLIPIVGLSLGPILALVIGHVMQMYPQLRWRMAISGLLFASLLLSLADARSRLVADGFENKVRLEQEIGELVNHSAKTIFLSEDYGVSLEYHGLLSGSPWPLASDLKWEQLAGMPALGAEARFKDQFAKGNPDYFIIMDMAEFHQQKDLEGFLAQHFTVIAQNNDCVIFDLRPR